MRGLVFGVGLFAVVISWSVSGSPTTAAELRAGAATIDITPTEPVPMWGYGSRHAAPSTGTADPLLAKAVVIAVGDTKLAIVGLDLGRSPTEAGLQQIRDAIQAKAGIEHSLIAGSHTHHGPVVELCNEPGKGQGRYDAAVRYAGFLAEQIEKVILEADGNLVPATVAAGSVELEGFNRNRHSKIQPVPVDRRLGVLRLDDAASGTPVAVLVNFTAHPTSIPDDTMTFSADYIGSLRETIEAKLGGTAIFMQGASGDLSTDRNGQDHRAYGAALGRAAVELAESLKPEAVTRPSLEVREERFTFASRVDFTNPVIAGIYSLAFFPELIATFVAEYTDGIRPRITVALLNDSIALVGGSGEFFCQHAIRLRERARVDELFFFGYCNGYHQYFPTIEAAAEGGYGADTQVAPAEVGAGETMMNAAMAWIFELQGDL
jgi:neutral ceramidase